MHNIDYTKLKRDYVKNPLKKGEVIDKDDLLYVYIHCNVNRPEAAVIFNVGEAVVKRSLHIHKIKKPKEIYLKKAMDTCMARYGSATPLQNSDILQKTRNTTKERYGVYNVFNSSDIQNKIKNTILNKYGVSSVLVLEENRKKALSKIKSKYGVKSFMQSHITNKDIWLDDLKFKNFIISGNNAEKWTTKDLSTFFNISVSTVQVRVGKLNLWDYIDLNSSQGEKELSEFITGLGFTVTKYKKNNIEFDIFIKEKNIAFEFNGTYWHSTDVRPDYKYHIKKSKAAEHLGIFLYHVFEYEWYTKRDRIKNQIRNLLGVNAEKIYARNCLIYEVSKHDSADFLDNNHIQGDAHAKVRLGLFYNGKLVSLMTFGKSRFNKEFDWELVRFCSKAGTNVLGGASKLFKYFVRTYKPKSIISYSDIARTKGTLYAKLGFNTESFSDPNYVWVCHNKVYSRYQCQKHLLVKRGYGSKKETEYEIMRRLNFLQVYDCGTRVHTWRI